MTNYRINQLGSQIRNGTARIVGRTTDDGLDGATWIVEDMERQTVEHVLCCARKTWDRYSVVTSVDLLNGPAGACGFRTGKWTATTANGQRFRFFSSVPHQMDLSDQRSRLVSCAQRSIDSGNMTWR